MKISAFLKCQKDYFCIYLPKQRNSSADTILSCHTAWNLLLRYLSIELKMDCRKLDFQDFTSTVVTGFLDFMESKAGWKFSTRNHRLSCIRSFFKYAAMVRPETCATYNDLLTIPLKKGTNHSQVVDYMSKDAMSALLNSVDATTRNGLRDQFFMAFMYDTAARDGEMLRMRIGDIDTKRSTAFLMGKGRKPRIVPVSSEVLAIFEKYRLVFHSGSKEDDFVFYTRHNRQRTPMSADNVARFIKGYATKARGVHHEIPTNVHPHMFRHSRAMHLYQGGMPLSMISELLGHASPETTLIYAYADTEMKRQVMEKASPSPISNDDTPIWKDKDILEELLRYC